LIDGDEDLAVDRAIAIAASNRAMQDGEFSSVVINEADVDFPETDIVQVVTHRTAATNDPLRLFFRQVVDPVVGNRADVTAVAAAQAFDVCAARCLKPWAIPDRWNDADADGEYDLGEPYDPEVTGYAAPQDVGLQITLKVGNPQSTIAPGLFFPVNYPPLNYPGENPLTGADWYREWIGDCEPYPVEIGDHLQVEPGNMVGPTKQGMDNLIALDPGAYWDSTHNVVAGSAFATSPRICLVPLFDPTLPPESGRNWVTVTRIGAFFVEETGPGGEVTGRFLEQTTTGFPCPGGLGTGFVKGIALIE
jgi:hypothetical protein